MTTPLRADLRPRVARATTPLAAEPLAKLRAMLATSSIDRVAHSLDVVPQTIKSAAAGKPLTRSVCGWLTVCLGFPRPRF